MHKKKLANQHIVHLVSSTNTGQDYDNAKFDQHQVQLTEDYEIFKTGEDEGLNRYVPAFGLCFSDALKQNEHHFP